MQDSRKLIKHNLEDSIRSILSLTSKYCIEVSLADLLCLQANQILGLRPGEVFVQRNVGNLATHKDMNCMTCLEYAVNALKVKHVIICGHYNCGAVKASITLSGKTQGLANLWVSDIKDTRNKHAEELGKLSPDDQVTRYLQTIPKVVCYCLGKH